MKKNNSIYLENLEFDEKLNTSWWSFFIDKMRFTWLVIILLTVAWLLWLKSLPLESNPEVDIWMAVVTTILPWASPESVEDLVTSKLEKEIWKVEWINTMTSTSRSSASVIILEFLSNADSKEVLRDLRDKVSWVESSLPKDAETPVVSEISFDDSPVWIFSISWDYDNFELYSFAKKIKDEIEANPLVSEVSISWWEEKEYWVLIDPKKLEQYDLTLENVNSAISTENITMPIWNINVGEYNHSINIDSRFYNLESLKNIIVKKLWDTWIIRLKDIAEVEETPKKVVSISRLSIEWQESLNAVTLSVTKKRWGSIVNLVSDWQAIIESMEERWVLPENLYITNVVDNWKDIKNDLNHLTRDGILTILLVFITLSIIIGTKEALVAWTAVPLVFFMTFAFMAYKGQTLNFLSMFSLILSLWLLVDDAIVIISAINQYQRTWKFTMRQSALLVIRDYKKVLISTTLTVVWIFGSMMFMTGLIWKFIFSIPFVICTTLLSSIIIALTINPALAVSFWGRNKKYVPESVKDKQGFKAKIKHFYEHWLVSMDKIEKKYWNFMKYIFEKKARLRVLILWVLVLFFTSLSFPITWILETAFFPNSDADNFQINLEAEAGVKLDVTSEITKKVEKVLLKEKDIKSFSVSIWTSSQDFGGSNSSENYASISVNLYTKDEGRKELSTSLVARLRDEFKGVKEAKVTIAEESGWPSTWWDFELKVGWDDFLVLEKISKDIIAVLETIDGAIDIESSRKALPFELNIALDKTKLALYDISVPQVASFLKNAVDWTEATKIYRWDEEIIVRTSFKSTDVDNLDKIKDLKLKNNKWNILTLRDVMNTDFKASVFSISRENQERVVTISATAWHSTNALKIQSEFDKKIANYKLPTGYKFIIWWQNEENSKSVSSLFTSMLFWMVFIIATLILLYNSFTQAFLVIVTIPLSLIWVFFGLTLFGQPLSFPWMIGMVALFGIVVRNGIILFDKINQNLNENISFKEAIVDAWMSRLEPVVLTSICTILWMIPLTLSNPIWTPLWLSIMCWLTASTIFTLVVLPSLYYIVFKRKYDRLARNWN